MPPAADEVELFRAAKFVKESPYGEVRFLKKGEVPEEMGPMNIADWFAQEADGAVIGRLRLDGVRDELRPIVVIDNEGSVHLSGFSLVDHFGSYTNAASANDLDALLAFCKKHQLPGPRTAAQIEGLAKRLKLSVEKLERGKVPKVAEANLRELQGSAPSLATQAKPAPVAAGTPTTPKGASVAGVTGPDGAPWFVVPPKDEKKTSKTALVRWTGKGFVQTGTIAGWVANLSTFQGQLAYDANGAVVLHDGSKETARIPYKGGCTALLASSKHLVIYSSWDKCVSKLDGKAFAVIGGSVDADGKPVLLDDHRLLLVYEKKTVVIDLDTGKATKWPKPSIEGITSLAVAGGVLVAACYGELATMAIDTGKWSAAKSVSASIGDLVALPDGDVVGFSNVPLAFPPTTNVHRISPRKLAVKQIGALHAGRNNVRAVAHDQRLVIVGGTSGTTTELAVPEVFDLTTGKGRAA